jgi:hypothetical protein
MGIRGGERGGGGRGGDHARHLLRDKRRHITEVKKDRMRMMMVKAREDCSRGMMRMMMATITCVKQHACTTPGTWRSNSLAVLCPKPPRSPGAYCLS